MAQLLVSAAGAAIGFAIGGPVGAQIGWAAGSIVGSLAFAPEMDVPKVGDLRAPGVQYGSKWLRMYGSNRTAGNLIWYSDKRVIPGDSGGKGTPDAPTPDTAEIDLLIGLAINSGDFITGIARVWINGELVSTNHAASDSGSIFASVTSDKWHAIRFLDGNPSQLPDPVIEASEGVGNAPAYRHRQCVLIDSLQLGQSGQIPLIEFEVAYGDTSPVCLAASEDGDGWGQLESVGGDEDVQWNISGRTATLVGTLGLSAFRSLRSSVERSDCKRYFELVLADSSSSNNDIGWAGLADGTNHWAAGYPGYSIHNGSTAAVASGPDLHWGAEPGDRVMFAIDFSSGKLWMGKNGTWVVPIGGGAAGDPAAGTNPRYTGVTGNLFIEVAYNPIIADASVTLCTAAEDFVYTPPDGFIAWDAVGQDATLIDPQTIDLADIVSAEWARVDDVSKIDVSELVGIPVTGFQTSGSVRGAYEALAPIKHFGAVCRDKLIFRLQGGAEVETINADYLNAGDEKAGDEPFAPERANDEEITAKVMLTYPNYSDDYANGTEDGTRPTTSTIEDAKQSNVVMTPSEAKAVAETLIAQAAIAATTGTINLPDRYAKLECCDPIIVPDAEGTLYRMVIQHEAYSKGIKNLDLVRDDVTTLIAAGVTSDNYTQSLTVVPPPETEIVLLDTAQLRDADNADPGFYAVANGSHQGSRLYGSTDGGTTYVQVAEFTAQSVFGDCTTTLPDWTRGYVRDTRSSLTVDVGDGELSSSTWAALLADKSVNACAIGVDGRWEICQFKTATLVSAGVYTLTGFLRGSVGTEWASTGHTSGETFVLLTQAARRIVKQTSELGVSESYKGVSAGRLLSTADAVEFTDNGNSKKPWAPVHVRVLRDAATNDATISLTRRTRMSTRFASSLGIACPLGEASERYEVDVYSDGTYTTVARTLSATTPSLSYSASEQTADGLTPGATLYLRAYQLSEIVGRGYAAEKAA